MQKVNQFFYYSQSFPALLHKIQSTLIYSTYQAGKVIMISSPNGQTITKYAKNFKRPMGLAISDDNKRLAVASKSEIDIFSTNVSLSRNYPERKNYYSHLYLPQAKYYTGIVDTHEIAWLGEELLITNTLFSSISKMSYDYHFDTYWMPEFITEVAPEDRCHLNGLALQHGEPAYVTLFARSNVEKGWRKMPYHSGILMDLRSGEVLLEELAMPHSPVVFDNKIYFLLSATGEVMYYDLQTRTTHQINQFNTFVRGLEVVGDYLFLGMSQIRKDSTFFSQLPVKHEDSFCGIRVLDRHTGKEVAGLTYYGKINEIFAVKVMNGVQAPGILTDRDEYYNAMSTITKAYPLKAIRITGFSFNKSRKPALSTLNTKNRSNRSFWVKIVTRNCPFFLNTP